MVNELITPSIEDALNSLKIELPIGDRIFHTYSAGTNNGDNGPGAVLFHDNKAFGWFTRDAITADHMRGDLETLVTDLEIVRLTMGTKNNPKTGEEYGKPPHEIEINTDQDGITTLKINYRSCDGANWYIIGHHYFWKKTENSSLLEGHRHQITASIDYILSHMDPRGIFWKKKATYFDNGVSNGARETIWTDSGLRDLQGIYNRENGIPHFPVAYAYQQAHISRALRDAADFAKVVGIGHTREELLKYAARAHYRIFDDFWDEELGTVVHAIDNGDKFRGIRSHGLSLLSHLEAKDVPSEKLESMVEAGMRLASEYGFLISAPHPTIPNDHREAYHLDEKIWPKVQWLTDETGHRYGLPELIRVSRGWNKTKAITGNSELVAIDKETGTLTRLGRLTQLWTTSLPFYFTGRPSPN